jgi:hypothetical protein
MRTCEITKIAPIKGGRFMKKLSLLFVLALILSLAMVGTAFAAVATVEPGGDIQAAINAATAGDTIVLQEGIYVNQKLNINKNLTIKGAGVGKTIIDNSALIGDPGYAGDYNISINSTSVVTLEGFTLKANKVDGPFNGISHTGSGSIKNVKVEDVKKSGLNLHQAKNLLVENVQSVNNGGAGIQITGLADDITLRNITTSGNVWGGVSINNRYGAVSGITIVGSNSFTDMLPLYLENYPGQPVITVGVAPKTKTAVGVLLQVDDFPVAVLGLPLTANTFDFFYTSGQDALAAAADMAITADTPVFVYTARADGSYEQTYQVTEEGYFMLDAESTITTGQPAARIKDGTFTFSDGAPIVNANRTGEKTNNWTDYRRRIPGQSTHTDFQKNTNSCASCHMTHTAAGASLLFRSGIYATCSACHDGSGIGTLLNVFQPTELMLNGRNNTLTTKNELFTGGEIKDAKQSRGVSGTFGVSPMMNGSVHLATGDLTIAAAPGGNRIGVKADGTVENANRFGTWASDFTCASCHAPHGSYSQRLMHYNPNNIMGRNPEDGGMRMNDLLVREAIGGDAGYLYFFPADTTDFAYANRVKGPFVYGYVNGGRTNNDWQYITFYDIDGNTLPRDMFSKYEGLGKVKLSKTLPTGTTISDVRASVTKALEVLTPTRGADMKISYSYDVGMNYNIFCASCHTDYELGINNVATGRAFNLGYSAGGTAASDLSGIYSKAHRHTTFRGANGGMEVVGEGQGAMICVSCHFVHGADSLIMKTADEVVIGRGAKIIDTASGSTYDNLIANLPTNLPSGVAAEDLTGAQYIVMNMDINSSSALKRYTNMSVCWKCHTRSHANTLKNNPYVWDKYTDITNNWHEYNTLGTYVPAPAPAP